MAIIFEIWETNEGWKFQISTSTSQSSYISGSDEIMFRGSYCNMYDVTFICNSIAGNMSLLV